MLTYSIFFCISMTLFTIIRGTFTDLHPIIILLIQALILFVVVSYFIRHICSICNAAAKNITTGWRPLIFANIVFMITVILSSIFPVRLTSFKDPAFLTFVFICASIMAVYPVVFSSINSMSEAAEKKAVEAQNKLLITQIEAKSAQIASDSRARHDRRHHNLVLLEFANRCDVESVKKYLENLMDIDSDVHGDIRYCENLTINTVLGVYANMAKEEGIPLRISAFASREIEIAPNDLVVIIANLFENAIHGALEIKDGERFIDILIKESPHRLLIKIENSCKKIRSFDENNHGIGIRSVINATNKYDGMCDFSSKDGMFSAKVNLNLR